MDERLRGRVDESDVLQETLADAARRLPNYTAATDYPFFLWLRDLAAQKLVDLHRRHLSAQKRSVNREVSLERGAYPAATSACLAAHLLGRLTSPSQAAVRQETKMRVQDALNSMEELDRELLALRHFEQLSNAEAAAVLGLNDSTASSRYLRALRKLKAILQATPGLFH